jgi:undecaprenyl-diphosphatase
MNIDLAMNAFMKTLENPVLTEVSKFVAMVTEPIVLAFVASLFSFVLIIKKRYKKGLFLGGTVLFSSFVVYVLKEVIQRARPMSSIITETGYSFPSGHALLSLVFFGMIFFLFCKKNRLFTILISLLAVLLIGFSRIYLSVHWFSDVFGGYLIGSFILFFSVLLYQLKR